MATVLNDPQRKVAHQALMFDRFFTGELSEAFHRATLACAENDVLQTGITF